MLAWLNVPSQWSWWVEVPQEDPYRPMLVAKDRMASYSLDVGNHSLSTEKSSMLREE